ncbi:MAG: LEA type 2 family protein [Treponema sp.]|jgi:LEA14-like dessication related protein|nr:LEA type 2 family protein [Treponema sp.]
MRKFLFFIVLLYLLTGCKSQKPVEPEIIEVIEPDFNIISIAVIQADLINTMFEAVIKIDNPNEFAVSLSSLGYELFGNGKLWADGKSKDIFNIPAQSSCETEFRFSMNFINMNRPLLDDIISKRQVRYRFAGNVEVAPDIPNIESFNMKFERSGLSGVKEKATDKLQTNSQTLNTGTNQSSNAQFIDNW